MATTISISDRMLRLRRRLQSTLGLIGKVATFLFIAVVGGLGSSWYVTHYGAAFNTERIGPWVQWTLAARLDADPYSLVQNDENQRLMFGSTFVSRYEARFDSDNRRLHSSCHYAIEGPQPPSDWWSIAVFDARGRLVANPAERYVFNASTVVPNADGSIRIDLARDARPGNWLPTSRAGRIVVVLEYQNRSGDVAASDTAPAARLPTIRRLDCR